MSLFFVARYLHPPDAYSRSFSEFFSVANVTSFFADETNKDNIIQQLFWAEESCMAICFNQLSRSRACERSGKRSGAGGKWGERERSGERAKLAAQSPLTPTLRWFSDWYLTLTYPHSAFYYSISIFSTYNNSDNNLLHIRLFDWLFTEICRRNASLTRGGSRNSR